MGGEFLKSERRRDALVIACLAILFLQLLLLRAPLHESLWLDETLSVWVALGSFQEVIERAFLFQGQSPLYFLILKEFARYSTDEFVLRLPSLTALLAAGIVFYRILRRWFTPEVCILGAALFLSIDHVMVAGLSARPYALGLLTALGATLTLMRWVEFGRCCARLFFWTALMVATFYFHYLFSAIAAVHLAFVAHRWGKLSTLQRGSFWCAVILGLLCAIPGLQQLAAISQRGELWDFVGVPSWRHLGHTLVPLGSVIFVGIGLVFTRIVAPYRWRSEWWRGSRANVVPLLIWWLAAPIFFFIHAHVTGHSLYLDRWFLWVAPASCIVVCAFVAGISERRPRFIVICVAIAFMIFREADRRWQVEDWRGASIAAREGRSRGPVLLYSGLVELESPQWIGDSAKAPYLGGPFTVYPIGASPILISSDPRSDRMAEYRGTMVEPSVTSSQEILLVAAKKSVTVEGRKEYVFDRWGAWLEARGFRRKGEPVPLKSAAITVQRFTREAPPPVLDDTQ
ncbi:MAG: hypothetical protein RL417_268 [Pseudomonadota bacterium]|jgi:hypothetical protein